jgi:hypothetical protein
LKTSLDCLARLTRALPGTLSVTLLLALALGCTNQPQPGEPFDTPEKPQDARIREAIVARLAAEPAVRGPIRVEVRDGTVTLYGRVQGLGAWQCAFANAELVDGVVTVADYLVLERGPREVPCRVPRPAVRRSGGLP